MHRRLVGKILLATLVLAPSLPARAKHDKDEKEGKAEKDGRQAPGLKGKVFELKHRKPDELANVVRPLLSGVPGSEMKPIDQMQTITVRDLPANLTAIEGALRRLDVPTPPKPDVELRLRVLIAGPDGPGDIPVDLDGVVKQLKETLNYKTYYMIASLNQRMRGDGSARNKGEFRLTPPVTEEPSSAWYNYEIETSIVPQPGGGLLTRLRRLRFQMGSKHLGEADINTSLTIKDGDKVVVGTASLKNRALIVVVTARLVRP